MRRKSNQKYIDALQDRYSKILVLSLQEAL